jgi:hypothetical protein
MVLEVSPSMNQAALGAKCNAKCFDYSKTGARPKSTSTMGQQPTWGASSATAKAKDAQQQGPSKHGSWGPVFKNKQNFIDMHLC